MCFYTDYKWNILTPIGTETLGRPVAVRNATSPMTSDAMTISVGISRALSNWVSKGTIAVVVDAEGSVGAGLTNESSRTKAESISIALAKTLWRPVAVRDSTSPVAGNSMAIAISIGISVSITFAIGTLWGSVAVRDSASPVTGNATAIAISISISITLANEVSEAASGVAAIAGMDAGLADESTRAQAKPAISVGISVSITLANRVSECTNTVVMEAKDSETRAGLADESTGTQS